MWHVGVTAAVLDLHTIAGLLRQGHGSQVERGVVHPARQRRRGLGQRAVHALQAGAGAARVARVGELRATRPSATECAALQRARLPPARRSLAQPHSQAGPAADPTSYVNMSVKSSFSPSGGKSLKARSVTTPGVSGQILVFAKERPQQKKIRLIKISTVSKETAGTRVRLCCAAPEHSLPGLPGCRERCTYLTRCSRGSPLCSGCWGARTRGAGQRARPNRAPGSCTPSTW
jgi:hypothetical protein